MTTETADLEYLRRVSARGAEAPLLGGRYTVWWGALATLAYFVHYLAASGSMDDRDGAVYPLVWIAFGIVGGVGQALLGRGRVERAGESSAGNRASRIVWFAAVAAILAFILGAIFRVMNSGDYAAFDASVPITFAAYGIALAVSGWLAPSPAARAGAVAAFATVTVAATLAGSPELWLAASVGALVSVFLPGLFVLRAEPSPDA